MIEYFNYRAKQTFLFCHISSRCPIEQREKSLYPRLIHPWLSFFNFTLFIFHVKIIKQLFFYLKSLFLKRINKVIVVSFVQSDVLNVLTGIRRIAPWKITPGELPPGRLPPVNCPQPRIIAPTPENIGPSELPTGILATGRLFPGEFPRVNCFRVICPLEDCRMF